MPFVRRTAEPFTPFHDAKRYDDARFSLTGFGGGTCGGPLTKEPFETAVGFDDWPSANNSILGLNNCKKYF